MARRIAVIGLGNFGGQLATELFRQGVEVLAIDGDSATLEDMKGRVTDTLQLDATHERALAAQGLEELDAVVVSFGENFEATVLTVMHLSGLGVKRLLVRATTHRHEQILNKLGVSEVILPVSETAERVARTLTAEGPLDALVLLDDYTIAEVNAHDRDVRATLGSLKLEELGLRLVTVRRPVARRGPLAFLGGASSERVLGLVKNDFVIERGDVLVVFGSRKDVERFASDR